MLKFIKYSKRKKAAKIQWRRAPDVKKQVLQLKKVLGLDWLDTSSLYFFRSNNSKSRAIARIWGLSKIWQMALGTRAGYIIEVIAERFDKLNRVEKDKVLLHEISHIPLNFSGALLPHFRRGKNRFSKKVDNLVAQYMRNSKARDK